jgi:hypothetical protein
MEEITGQATRVDSTEFKHSDTCGLFNPHHSIPERVANVVRTLRDMDDFEAVAGGCNGCTVHTMDHGVYYIAQHGEKDYVYFGYTDKSAAYTLIGACEQAGVEHDWDGDFSSKVAVGTDDTDEFL